MGAQALPVPMGPEGYIPALLQDLGSGLRDGHEVIVFQGRHLAATRPGRDLRVRREGEELLVLVDVAHLIEVGLGRGPAVSDHEGWHVIGACVGDEGPHVLV